MISDCITWMILLKQYEEIGDAEGISIRVYQQNWHQAELLWLNGKSETELTQQK